MMILLQAVSSEDRRKRVRTEVRSPLETVLSRTISFIFTVIVVFLGLRFLLLLFGANQGTAFVDFIYSVSNIFMAPFAAVFPTQTFDGATFEWSSLLAMAIYALISWGIIALIHAVSPRESAVMVESDVAVDRDVAVAPDPDPVVVVDRRDI